MLENSLLQFGFFGYYNTFVLTGTYHKLLSIGGYVVCSEIRMPVFALVTVNIAKKNVPVFS